MQASNVRIKFRLTRGEKRQKANKKYVLCEYTYYVRHVSWGIEV